MARTNPYQKLLIVTCLGVFTLIVLGGVVRISESGLGCPDWPRCHGKILPPLEREVLIEFSHRLLAAVVGFLVLACAAFAWKSHRHQPAVLLPAALALLLLIAQVLLGGATVNLELPPEIVTAHQGVAMALLAALLVATVSTFLTSETARPWATSAQFPALALLAALASFALILTGAYVAGSGAGLAFDDWPLFNGKLLPEGGRLANLHFLHRLVAVLVGFLILALTLETWRHRQRLGLLTTFATLSLFLYIAQVLVGAANVWSSLQPALATTHVAIAAALWSSLVVLTASAYYILPQPASVRELAREA